MKLDEILRVLEEVTDLSGPRRRLPHALVWVFAALSELWAGDRPAGAGVARCHPLAPRLDRALLGARRAGARVTFRPLEATIRDAVGWYRSEPRFVEKIARKDRLAIAAG